MHVKISSQPAYFWLAPKISLPPHPTQSGFRAANAQHRLSSRLPIIQALQPIRMSQLNSPHEKPAEWSPDYKLKHSNIAKDRMILNKSFKISHGACSLYKRHQLQFKQGKLQSLERWTRPRPPYMYHWLLQTTWRKGQKLLNKEEGLGAQCSILSSSSHQQAKTSRDFLSWHFSGLSVQMVQSWNKCFNVSICIYIYSKCYTLKGILNMHVLKYI